LSDIRHCRFRHCYAAAISLDIADFSAPLRRHAAITSATLPPLLAEPQPRLLRHFFQRFAPPYGATITPPDARMPITLSIGHC